MCSHVPVRPVLPMILKVPYTPKTLRVQKQKSEYRYKPKNSATQTIHLFLRVSWPKLIRGL